MMVADYGLQNFNKRINTNASAKPRTEYRRAAKHRAVLGADRSLFFKKNKQLYENI